MIFKPSIRFLQACRSPLVPTLACIAMMAVPAHAQDISDRSVTAVEIEMVSPSAPAPAYESQNTAAVTTRTEEPVAAESGHGWTSSLPIPPDPQFQPAPPPYYEIGIHIGNATQDLFALQRTSPGMRARPIDGEQASRSYARYLKSFETKIPEHYEQGMNLKGQ